MVTWLSSLYDLAASSPHHTQLCGRVFHLFGCFARLFPLPLLHSSSSGCFPGLSRCKNLYFPITMSLVFQPSNCPLTLWVGMLECLLHSWPLALSTLVLAHTMSCELLLPTRVLSAATTVTWFCPRLAWSCLRRCHNTQCWLLLSVQCLI